MKKSVRRLSTLLGTFFNLSLVWCSSSTLSEDNTMEMLGTLVEYPEEQYTPKDFLINRTAVERLRESLNNSHLSIEPGALFEANITKSKENEFFFLLHVTVDELTVVMTPCSAHITWKLFYREPEFRPTAPLPILPTDKLLHEYSGSDPTFFNCSQSPLGLYLIRASTNEEHAYVQIYTSTAEGGPFLMNISESKNRNRIRVKKNFEVYPPVVQLSLPQRQAQDQFFILYIISREKFYNSICSVLSENPGAIKDMVNVRRCSKLGPGVLQMCQEDGEISYPVNMNLEPSNNSYHVSVFARDVSGFSVRYSKVNFTFKMFPIQLHDNEPHRVNMTTNGGRFSFKYKVRKNNLGNNVRLSFYVLPCPSVAVLTVEIKHRKRVIIRERIDEYKKFDILNPHPNHRYVIKIKNESYKTSAAGFESVEVLATIRSTEFPLPSNVAVDPRVNATAECPTDANPRGAVTALISWFPLPSNESLVYCVFVNQQSNALEDMYRTPIDICYPLIRVTSNKHRRCMMRNSQNDPLPFFQRIRQLRIHVNYVVQVTVRKLKSDERFLSYKILNVRLSPPVNCSVYKNFTDDKFSITN